MKRDEIIELLFNFDFNLKRLRIRILLEFSLFINDESRIKLVFSIHCFFFFIVFFGNVNVMIRIFLIELTNNKGGVLRIFKARE